MTGSSVYGVHIYIEETLAVNSVLPPLKYETGWIFDVNEPSLLKQSSLIQLERNELTNDPTGLCYILA